ncbi:flagellar hook-basal body complex protein [Pseudohongiella sp. SYSU M77423]|uniref:flagellar hook-basal body complex protein n=1 Tax=Pseudohongiella sp. SYSU M77423 TaxID=3042312 RepID=UPI0024800E6F|nr:flagellar hook-basal body complex protein [Pseudohongiella sp. SYSU M77423]MDH7944877.1 flagellar hook-basal body complex protein [Pseudohongiella sp. SYSU M77423]MEC8860887.1 flagellar hook-basal body complex protein [Pseudomonadota bacterium]
MSFIIGLSALNAAQQEINVTGNNIANAGTNGFKSSKAVFGDVYAASVLGGGGTQQGSGVTLQGIQQSFNQGNISFTENTLDLAINGEGFFILSGESGTAYTRAGAFGTDRFGYVVTNTGERLQGFAPSESGQATGGGPLTDLRVTTGELQPRATTLVESEINLDAAAMPSAVIGSTYISNGGNSSQPRLNGAMISPDSDPNSELNPYTATSLVVRTPSGETQQLDIAAGASANAVAQQFAGVEGVAAVGTTVGYISNLQDGADADNQMRFAINGRDIVVDLTATNPLQDLANKINALLNNLNATVDGTRVRVTHSTGADIRINAGGNPSGALSFEGSTRDATTGVYSPVGVPTVVNVSAGDIMTMGGFVEFTLDENVSLRTTDEDLEGNPVDPSDAFTIFGDISAEDALTGTAFESNQFDPRNPETYYRSTAISIYDSVGTRHSLAMYFVKERPDDTGDTNLWSVYFQIDGRNIGYDPNSSTGDPVLARFDLRFDDTGRFDPNQQFIEITNWYPVDSSGRRIGAGPVPGNANVSDQTTNSNFRIDLSSMTAFGGDFSVQSNNQDGFSKGQLTGLEVNTRGLVSARFSNGQSQVLGEVALANFANASGLANLGGTKFAETSESGAASVSGAGTAGLGAIQSGALEDSNVDLPTELVQLIISQRNYQAAAQIISATDDATQTIINL